MQTVDELEVSLASIEQRTLEQKTGLSDWLRDRKILVVTILFAMALGARLYGLDSAGLCEDETNKVFAVRSYKQGDFTANAEHPMVMKLLCFASLSAADLWNRTFAINGLTRISEEASLRFPNAFFGALTVVPLFLFAMVFFGFRVALITSFLWAVGLNAIWFNRIGKEDTLLVFFMLCGFYLYNRAKERPAADVVGQELYYVLSGVAFGLMLASKYFPHYYGFFMLFYHLAGYNPRNNRPLTRRQRACHFGAMVVSFVAFNFAAFVPKTWRYVWAFVNEDLLTHHGYLLGDDLFVNEVSHTPFGIPWYFYFLFLCIKLPLPVLAAFIVGTVEVFRRRGPRGYLFLRVMLLLWLVPMSIVGAKWTRYTLGLMPIVYITAAVGVMALWRLVSAWITRRASVGASPRFAPVSAVVLLSLAFVVAPAAISLASLPYPSLYLSPLGGNRIGYYFPHDEFYDIGARESIRYIADRAPAGAIVASEIPGVLSYYLERFGRTDIRSEIMSNPGFDFFSARPDFVILQRGRMYFENRNIFSLIEANYPVVQESRIRGGIACQVFATGTRDSVTAQH